MSNNSVRTHLAVDEDNEDSKTVEEILQKVEGAAREERRKYSKIISILIAVLLAAVAVYWLLS